MPVFSPPTPSEDTATTICHTRPLARAVPAQDRTPMTTGWSGASPTDINMESDHASIPAGPKRKASLFGGKFIPPSGRRLYGEYPSSGPWIEKETDHIPTSSRLRDCDPTAPPLHTSDSRRRKIPRRLDVHILVLHGAQFALGPRLDGAQKDGVTRSI